MANVRSRPKTQSTAKKGCGVKRNTVNKSVESIAVMKSTSVKPTNDQVQYLVSDKDINNKELPKAESTRKKRVKKKDFPGLVTKSGRIKKKCKGKFMLLNNILKSELQIHDNEQSDESDKNNTNKNVNNNNITVNNHNKASNISSDVNGKTKSSNVNKEDKQQKPKRTPSKTSPKKVKVTKAPEPLSLLAPVHIPIPAPKPKFITEPDCAYEEPSIYECDHCCKTFKTKTSMKKHIYGHLNLKPHQCPHCPKKFHYHLNMQVHVMKLHINVDDESLEPCICSICGKAFLLKETLNAHLSEHHSKKASFFKCIYCEKKFSDYTQLIDHEKVHLVTGRYQCPTCGYSYGIRDHFEAHLKCHSKVKDFICQHCGKEFLRLNSMQRHMQVYHAGHRIQCPICKKKLRGHLTEHLRTHDKKRPHECPECGQCFTQSTQLTVHRRSHSGARPYPCKICARSFSHSTALSLHIRRHTGEKPFRCAMCPLMFSQLPHMKAHMRTIHGKENAYKCKKCTQFFKLKVDLERHAKLCAVGDKKKDEQSVQVIQPEAESATNLSRMRYLLALLLTIISTKDKLKYLGFNKRLIDDLLVECLEAMGLTPCKDESLSPYKKLKTNIDMLLIGTVPKEQMEKMKSKNKTTEELLELLTDEKKND